MNENSEECEIDLAIEDSNYGETWEDKKGAENVAIIIDWFFVYIYLLT